MTILAKIRDRIARFGIQVKLASAVAIGAVIVLSVGFALQLADKNASLESKLLKNSTLISELVASQLGAPTKFLDGNRVASIYTPVTEDDASIIAVDVIHADEGVLSAFDRTEERSAATMSLMEEAHQVLLSGETEATLANEAVVVAAQPLKTASSSKPVGFLVIAWDLAPFRAVALQEALTNLATSALSTIFALLMIVFLAGRLVTRPVKELGFALERIAEHEYDSVVPSANRKDEIGQIAKSLVNVKDRLVAEENEREVRAKADQRRVQLFNRLAEGLSEIADGRVDRPIDTAEFSELGENSLQICKDFNDVLLNLKSVLSTVTRTAETVRSSAQEISESVVDQSKRSEAQAVTLEESAAAIETLSMSVEQTADHAAEANKRITQNRQQAQSGGEVVEQTVQAMRNIEQSSDKITAIIGVIDDIAFQTNLLALNAGVEAARAGEAGRGFAVVASEVRALAQRASESANEIKELILTSGEQVTKGSELVNKAGAALEEIINGVTHASDLVSQIASGSRDQADNLREIKESVTELDRVTQRNAAMIEESSAASRSLSDEAANMSKVLKVFKLTDADLSETPAPVQQRSAKAAPEKAAPPKTATAEPAQPETDAAKTKEWDDDAAKDARAKRKAPASASASATTEKPKAKPVKVAVNQSAPTGDTSSESWEDF